MSYCKVQVTVNGRTQAAYVPTFDAYDNPLPDTVTLDLVKMVSVDLFYQARGDLDRDLAELYTPELPAPTQSPARPVCQCGHWEVQHHTRPPYCEVPGCQCQMYVPDRAAGPDNDVPF